MNRNRLLLWIAAGFVAFPLAGIAARAIGSIEGLMTAFAGLVVSSAEFLGPNEERGWALAGAATPILYIAWSVWLLGLGIALIA